VLLVAVAALTTVYALLNARKKNKLLAEQKNEISLKNAELEITQEELKSQRDALEEKTTELVSAYNNIQASINYAKRIQTAILPPISLIRKHLPDSFVFFRPRDIVSGDFYWFSETKDGGIIIAAADCTGHGVPGAFMSMIGDSLFNHAVLDKQIYAPDLILAELDKGIRQALRKGEEYAKDGMDLSVCYIPKEQNYVLFAGAMNPICYVQNNTLNEIKADKRAVGGDYTENYVFTAHKIETKEPTMFYMYSDGFQDQFGGENNKKFLTKRFRELLFEIHQETPEKQAKILEERLLAWMGKKMPQIDDVLVIGFRIASK
jgi:serine phosphatase RsbU (regulator of sigma subunit)